MIVDIFGSGLSPLGIFLSSIFIFPIGIIISFLINKKQVLNFLTAWFVSFLCFFLYVLIGSDDKDFNNIDIIILSTSIIFSGLFIFLNYKKSIDYKKTTKNILINIIILIAAVFFISSL